jgi:hypothetical protein
LKEARERLERLRAAAVAPDHPLLPARHSCDFSFIHWYGTDYHFTAAQAAIVAILWREWTKGTPDVRHETLLEETGAAAKRFADLFKGSPAWGTLIVCRGHKGTARLNDPGIIS